MSRIKLELCVASLEAARLAKKYEFDRIETCTSLEVGGLTPTLGLVNWIKNTLGIEQHVLVRQRAGGFNYSYDEIVVMRDDIIALKEIGIKGIVVGALKEDFTLNTDALELFVRSGSGLELTFHRAFDEVKDWKVAMDQLIRIGFKRILTSGQSRAVNQESILRIKEMIEYANGRIELQIGGGVNLTTINELKAIGISGLHFSSTQLETIDENSLYKTDVLKVNEDLMKQLLDLIQS